MKLFTKNIKVTKYILIFVRFSKRSKTYKRSYRNIARHISNFEKHIDISITSDIFDDALMYEFINYLKDQNLMISTISSIVDKTKHMLRRMHRDSYRVDMSVFDVKLQAEKSNAVYLTSDEIERLYNMKTRGKEQEIAKDLFVVGCLTGMRFSDYSQLTSKNIVGNTIQLKTRKTGEVVIVPIHRIVREIIIKYNGFPRYENSLQNFNKMIKRICKRAGIADKILIERTKGHNIERRTVKKYEMVGSHTARRSFSTNAYLAGILPAKIMLITGHKTEEAFFLYIRINKRKNANELLQHPFFN